MSHSLQCQCWLRQTQQISKKHLKLLVAAAELPVQLWQASRGNAACCLLRHTTQDTNKNSAGNFFTISPPTIERKALRKESSHRPALAESYSHPSHRHLCGSKQDQESNTNTPTSVKLQGKHNTEFVIFSLWHKQPISFWSDAAENKMNPYTNRMLSAKCQHKY